MIVKSEQIEALKPYIDNIEDLVKSDDVQSVLDAIDDVIVDNILANNDEPDDEGIKLQKIYDEIFNQNEFSWDDPNMKKICGECHFKDKNPELCHAVEPPMKKPFVPTDISSCSFLRESQWQRMPKEKQDEVNEYVAERSKKHHS